MSADTRTHRWGPWPPRHLRRSSLEGLERRLQRCAASTGHRASRRDVLEIAPGEAYGLVGESGCGKSTTAYAALRYLPRNGKHHRWPRSTWASDDITNVSTSEQLQPLPGDARPRWCTRTPRSAHEPDHARSAEQLVESFTGARPVQGRSGEAKSPLDRPRARCASPIPPGDGPLPVPALRRHAAARRHRHGPGLQPEAARARRAHHRPRRHGGGRGARPRAHAAPARPTPPC